MKGHVDIVNFFASTLRKHYNQILRHYIYVRKTIKNGKDILQADEWILDNFYIIEEKTKELLQIFSKRDFKKLNKRAFSISCDYLKNHDYAISSETVIETFENRYLFDSEINLLPQILELVILCLIPNILFGKKNEHEKAVAIGHCIKSLKDTSKINPEKIFSKISKVEQILLSDFGDFYAKMTEKTKKMYRERVEAIAKRRKVTPFAVAKEAVDLSKKKKRHVGYFLVTTELGETLGKKRRTAHYFYALFLIITVLLLTVLMGFLFNWWIAVITLIPFSEVIINIVNYFVTKFVKPRFIPRMDFSKKNGGIPEEFRTQVVIPAMLDGLGQAEDLIKRMEVFHLANEDDNLRWTLICDCKEDIRDIIKTNMEEIIDNLNKKYGEGKFSLFLRREAWERKRGALIEYAQSIRGRFKYIITLDVDTKLNRGTAAQLIGAMAHPLNQPKISRSKLRVLHGYGMMQPRMMTDVRSANRTLFSKIFAGQGGIDSYSFAVSDVYQDLFGEGIFVGKGIFDVEAFCTLLPRVIKENSVLSHDLLEGSILRTALIGDVVLVDDFPMSYRAFAKRNHRWMRGDWQLLTYLKCNISAISRWKMIDNLRRSILPICLAGILFVSPIWLPFVLLVLCSQLLISTIEWALSRGYKTSGTRFHATIIFGLKGIILQAIFLFLTLLNNAYLALDAIIRTVWRVFVSHKKLLEWTTASTTENDEKKGLISEFGFMLPSLVISLLITIMTSNYVGIIWLFAPLFTYGSGRVAIHNKPKINSNQDYILRNLASKIWQYYEDFATIKTNFLAPDNYQENPSNGIAMRTSPTNIGMHIMASICAFDLGFIDMQKLYITLERILNSVEKVEKWNGNLFNWYNIENLAPLNPRYVSTVDSGNLLGYLMTASESLKNFDNNKFEELIIRIEIIAEEMKLSPLFDDEAGLFSIGYNVERQELTQSYYDLLASEVRQTVYIAICRNEIPLESWAKMGRTLVSNGGYRGLVSWSGSMFEYLMPLLIMENIPNTLLDETYHFCIREQRRYAKTQGIPVWGVSESGFNSFDMEFNYQYRAFGVPELGVSRGILSDIVIAPYASVLALMVDFDAAMENIEKLNELGFCGHYGFYEAIDYTPKRMIFGEKNAIVRSFMVHHLGMSLLSINNVLNNNILQKRFMGIPIVASASELLNEKVPTNVIISKETQEETDIMDEAVIEIPKLVREFEYDSDIKKVHVISSKKASVVVDSNGKNSYNYGRILFNSEECGSVIEVNGYSVMPFPKYDKNGKYSIIFASEKIEFVYNSSDGLDITTTIILSNEESAKITKVLIANNTDETKKVEVSTFAEIVLCEAEEYYAHPVFSKLFTKNNIQDNIVFFERKGEFGAIFSKLGDVTPQIETSRGILRDNINTIDSIAKYSFKYQVPSHKNVVLINIEAIGENEEELFEIVKKMSDEDEFLHQLELAESRSRVEAKHLNINIEAQELAFENLDFATKKFAQSRLWKYGISGDYPIFSYLVGEKDDKKIENLLGMHKLLLMKGIKTDLIFMIEQEGYEQPILTNIARIVQKENYNNYVKVLSNLNESEIALISRCGRSL